MIEGIAPEIWLQIEQEGKGDALRDLLKDYEKMMEDRKKTKENDNESHNDNEDLNENGNGEEGTLA